MELILACTATIIQSKEKNTWRGPLGSRSSQRGGNMATQGFRHTVSSNLGHL